MAWAVEHGFDNKALTGFTAACEFPQVYTQSKSKGDPNDLISLAAVDGAIADGCEGEVITLKPRDWKGQLHNDATDERIRGRLTAAETKILAECKCPPSLLHNVVDAIGIGLKAVNRFELHRVFSA